MVVVIDRGHVAARLLHGGGQTAFELVVVVGIEQVVLAVVLVVQHGLDRAEPRLEQRRRGNAAGARAIGIAAPGDIGARQVGGAGPAALVDQRLQPRAIGAGF